MYFWSAKLFLASLFIFYVVNLPSSEAASMKTSSVDAPEELDRASDLKEDPEEGSTVVASSSSSSTTTTTRPPKKTSALILIRDVLKKVTTSLKPSTQQVANNALQYFQLFERLLQQTIEQVIDVVEESVVDATTVKNDEVNSGNSLTTKSPETLEVSSESPGNPEKETSSMMPGEKEEEKGRTSL